MESLVKEPLVEKDKTTNRHLEKEFSPGGNGYQKQDPVLSKLFFFRSHFRKLLLIGLLASCISFFFMAVFYVKPSSSVVFLIDDSDPKDGSATDLEKMILTQLSTLNKNRLFFFIYSDQMARLLNKQINMATHYGLDANKPDLEAELIEILKSHVSYSRDALSRVTLEVRDNDKNYAALLANTIYKNLLEISKETIYRSLRYKLQLYGIKNQSLELKREQDMAQLIYTVNQLPLPASSMSRASESAYIVKQDIMKVFTEYNNTFKEQDKMDRLFQINSSILQDTSMQTLFLINRAYPKDLKRGYINSAFFSLGIGFIMMLYSFVVLMSYKKYQVYFQVLFRNRDPFGK